ncbi:MAG: hypothetical protein HY282_05895 [Nitrospirae bacterium]|nr:hypothetical protein [Candidatus Manganitrophaceae bacterium]
MFREEKTFVLRFSLEAQFPEEYEGEEDGHAWLRRWESEIKPEILKNIFLQLRGYGNLTSHIRNRGLSAEDEIEIVIEIKPSEPSGPPSITLLRPS